MKLSGLKFQLIEDYLKREYAEKICLSKTIASIMRNCSEGRREGKKERGKREKPKLRKTERNTKIRNEEHKEILKYP